MYYGFIDCNGTIFYMPQGDLPDSKEKPVRATRKRASVGEADMVRAIRARAPRRTTATPIEEEIVEATTLKATQSRKAPTPIASDIDHKKSRRKQLIIAGIVVCVGFASSAAFGLSDEGKINVAETLASRDGSLNEGGTRRQNVPVQNTSTLPDGGLVPVGDGNTPPVVEAATTTEQSASTTEDVAPTEEGNVPTSLAEPEAEADTEVVSQ
jgi:hypothetical protein